MIGYWKYKAFDALLHIEEGVLIAPIDRADNTWTQILVKLRQQGLQGIELIPITKAEYTQALRLRHLKERFQARPLALQPTHHGQSSLQVRLSHIRAAIRRWLRRLLCLE